MHLWMRKLVVKTPKGTKITKAELPDGEEIGVIEIARNEYNVSMPRKQPTEPFVIRLQIEDAASAADKYRDALT